MITEDLKLNCITFVKRLAIRSQMYESASCLRDIEKDMIDELSIDLTSPSYFNSREINLSEFNFEHLNFIDDLVSKYFKDRKFDIDMMVPEIRQLRRELKIRNLIE